MKRLTMAILVLIGLLQASLAHAVGLFLPDKGRHLQLVEARVFLSWDADKKIQAMTVQPILTGNAQHFAWIIATPKKVKLDEMPRDFFQALNVFTMLEPMDARFTGKAEPPPFQFPPAPKASEKPKVHILDGGPGLSLDFVIFEPDQEDRMLAWGKKRGFDTETFAKLLVPELKKGLVLTILHADATTLRRNKEGVFEHQLIFPVRFLTQAEAPVLSLALTKHCVKDHLRLQVHTASASKLDLAGDLSFQPAWLEKWTRGIKSAATDKRTDAETDWLALADSEAPNWQKTLKMLADEKRTPTLLRYAKRLTEEDIKVMGGKARYSREAPASEVESMRHLVGHFHKGQFLMKMDAVVGPRELAASLTLVPAQVGGKNDELTYTTLFPSLVLDQEIKERHTFQGPASGISSLAISSDGQTLAVAGKEKTVILRSAVTGKELTTLPDQTSPVVSMAFSADGKTLATFRKDKTVTIFDVAAGKESARFKDVKITAGLCAISADGKVVIAHVANGSGEKDDWVEVRLLDVASGKNRAIAKRSTPIGVPGISANFTLLALAPDGNTLAVGTTDVGGGFHVRVLNTATGKELKSPGELDREAKLAFSRDGNSLISFSDRTIKTWDLASGKVRSSLKAVAGIAAISGDGRTLVTVGPKNVVKIWEAPPPDDLK